MHLISLAPATHGRSTHTFDRNASRILPVPILLNRNRCGWLGHIHPKKYKEGGVRLEKPSNMKPTTHQLPYDIQHTQYCKMHNIKVHRTTEGGITVLELWCVLHLLSTYISSARLRIVYACLCLAFILQLEDTDSSSNLVTRGRNNKSNVTEGRILTG